MSRGEGRAITILHLSDLQFGRHHRFADPHGGFDTLLQRLCVDLDLLAHEQALVPDLVALTGDLAEGGGRENVIDASQARPRGHRASRPPRSGSARPGARRPEPAARCPSRDRALPGVLAGRRGDGERRDRRDRAAVERHERAPRARAANRPQRPGVEWRGRTSRAEAGSPRQESGSAQRDGELGAREPVVRDRLAGLR